MTNGTILQPVIGMMLLTLVVWVRLFAVRIPSMQKLRLPVQTYTTPDKTHELLPEVASYPANNLKNLFELPVIFYALCLLLFITDNVDQLYVMAAWGFLGFRVLHSLIHCTVNRVMPRFICYLVSSILLWAMVVRAAFDLLLA
jgi:hypothetical protein